MLATVAATLLAKSRGCLWTTSSADAADGGLLVALAGARLQQGKNLSESNCQSSMQISLSMSKYSILAS